MGCYIYIYYAIGGRRNCMIILCSILFTRLSDRVPAEFRNVLCTYRGERIVRERVFYLLAWKMLGWAR